MMAQHARRVSRHYALLLGAVAMPLLLLVIALALQQFAGQRRTLLDELAGRVHAERAALEPVFGVADGHVTGMREFAEDRLTGLLPQPETPLRRKLSPTRHANGVTGVDLDNLANSPVAARIGNVLGDRALMERSPAAMAELDQALEMFAPMRLAHIAAPQLRWSYYLSAQGDFLTMFPFATSSNLTARGDYPKMRALIAGGLEHDVLAAATPSQNPSRSPYWTGVHRDATGAGSMVSQVAPVYAGDHFMGVVGTDIPVAFLNGFLRSVAWPVGRVLIVNDAGQILTWSSNDGTTTTPASVEEALPEALAALPLTELLASPAGIPGDRWLRGPGGTSGQCAVLAALCRFRSRPDQVDPAPLQALCVDPGRPHGGPAGRTCPAATSFRPTGIVAATAHSRRERRPHGRFGSRPGAVATLVRHGQPGVRRAPRIRSAPRGQRGPIQGGGRERPRSNSRSSMPTINSPSATATIRITSPRARGRPWRWARAGRIGPARLRLWARSTIPKWAWNIWSIGAAIAVSAPSTASID